MGLAAAPPAPSDSSPRSVAERIRELADAGSPVVVAALTQAIPAGPGVRLVPAVTVQPELVDWAWAGRIPVGMLSLLVGEGGLGKSLLGCHLAAGFSRGTIPGNFEGQPVDVAIASSEDHRAAVIVPRLIAHGADLTRVHFVEQVDEEGVASDIDIDGSVDRIEAALSAQQVRFLFIDTVVSHVPSEHDSHKEQHVRRVLAPLARMAERCELAVLGTMHLNRRENRNVLTRIMGSGGFGNLARSVLVVGLDPQEAPDSAIRLLAHGKCNVGRMAPTLRMRVDTTEANAGGRVYTEARVRLLGEVPGVYASDILSTEDAGQEERSARQEAAEFLQAELAEGARPAKDLIREARQCDISEKTLRRAQKELGVTASREGVPGQRGGGRWVWFLGGQNDLDARVSDTGTLIEPEYESDSEGPSGGHVNQRPCPVGHGPTRTRPTMHGDRAWCDSCNGWVGPQPPMVEAGAAFPWGEPS